MNAPLAQTLTEIRDIGRQIKELGERSKQLRLSLRAYYTGLQKHSDGHTGLVFLPEHSVVGYIKPVQKDPDDPNCKIEDFTVTFEECDVARVDE